MGFFDALSDLLEAATPWSTVEAEAPAEDKKDEENGEVCVFLLLTDGNPLDAWGRDEG